MLAEIDDAFWNESHCSSLLFWRFTAGVFCRFYFVVVVVVLLEPIFLLSLSQKLGTSFGSLYVTVMGLHYKPFDFMGAMISFNFFCGLFLDSPVTFCFIYFVLSCLTYLLRI